MIAHSGPTFATYDLTDMLPNGVYGLSNGLLPEMARALGYTDPDDDTGQTTLLGDTPTEQALRGFIKHIGPAKTLQDNIALVQERLRTEDNAVTIAADWADRSGTLLSLDRSVIKPDLQAPDLLDIVITGGVVRWELRRLELVIRQIVAKRRIGKVTLVAGNRMMAASEHALAAAFHAVHGQGPDEHEFMEGIIAPQLRFIGLRVRVVRVNSGDYKDVMACAAAEVDLTKRAVVVVGNAPSAIMNAMQLREAGRAIDKDYDRDGDRLYVISDCIEVARHGEGPELKQNPFSLLPQIGRNALHVFLEQLSLNN